jgi:hypothetical protein
LSLAESFLRLVEHVTRDLDLDRLRADVARFEARHPLLSAKEKARLLIDVTARKAAAIGAVASLPPGLSALVALAPELAAVLALQSRLIVALHLLHGCEPEPEERALEVLAGLAAGAGMQVGRRFGVDVAERVAGRLLVRLAGREATHFIPLLGAGVAAFLNYTAVQGVGRAALRRLQSRYGPAHLPGGGRVIDVTGSVA